MDKLIELTLTISNVPTGTNLSLTQYLAEDLGLHLTLGATKRGNLKQVDII